MRVVVLDMDGVILRTSELKVRAMLSLFAGHPKHDTAIRRYILANTGVPRRGKIVTILEDIIGVHADAAQVDRYLERYAEILERDLATAALVEGVDDYIRTADCPLYVSSSAPDAEVLLQLRRRGLDHRFRRIYGESTPKAQALREVMAAHPGEAVVFFGDSVSDREAARAAATAFVGVIAEADHFGHDIACKLASFRDPHAVRQCIDAALGQLDGTAASDDT